MVKYIKNNKNKVCALLAILIVLLLFIGTTNLVVYGEVNSYLEFEQLDLQEELESISTFDFLAHPPVSSPTKIKPTIYKVIEYCYSYYSNYSSNYGVYVYMYNPNQLEILESGKNKITLATKHRVADNAQIATDYEKFELKFISKTSGAYNNLFYKFKIVDHKDNSGKSMYERVNKLCRQYDISEIELQEKNELGANLLCSGGRFKFTGYAEGYGYDSEEQSTLQCTQEGLESLELELNHTWFRTPTSSMGKGYQNQLDAVYFTVPNKILENYGDLKQIKANWYEYKTSPVVVFDSKSMYDEFKGKIGVKDSSLSRFGTNCKNDSIVNTEVGYCDWGFNVPSTFTVNKFKSDFLAYIQYCEWNELKDWVYKSKDIRDYIYSYNKSYHTGKIDVYSSVTKTNISNDLFVDFVDAGHTRGFNEKIFDADQVDQQFNLLDYSSNHSGWDKFKDYFLSYPKDQSYTNISPIMPVSKADLSLSDEEFSTKYLIDIKQVPDFKDYVKKTNDTVFKFNFSFTQYESDTIEYYSLSSLNGGTYIGSSYGIMSQETVYLDFDIIWLKFVKGLDSTIIPVAALPIDAIPDFTAPPWLDNNLWDSFLEMLMYILITIATIILIVIFIRLFGMPILLFLSTRTKKPKNKINISIDSKQIKNAKKTKYNKYEVDLAKERFDRKKIKKE